MSSTSSARSSSGGGGGGSLTRPLLLVPGNSRRRFVRSATIHNAVVGAKDADVESLDYEVWESEEARAQERMALSDAMEYGAVRWVLTVLIGAAIGALAFAINLAVESIAGSKLSMALALINLDRPVAALLLFCGFSVVLAAGAAALCVLVAPAAGGSGIPEVKAYLNGVRLPHVLEPITLLVKVLGSTCSVASGLMLGKEGPLVHIGACVAHATTSSTVAACRFLASMSVHPSSLSSSLSGTRTRVRSNHREESSSPSLHADPSSAPLPSSAEAPAVAASAVVSQGSWQQGLRRLLLQLLEPLHRAAVQLLPHVDNDRIRHNFVTVGAGAGVAAAFQCPVAGVLFALEELNSWWKKRLVWKALFANAVGAIVLRSLASACEASAFCNKRGGAEVALFDSARRVSFGLADVLSAAVLGVMGGLLGALFNHASEMAADFRARFISRRGPWTKVFEAAAIATVTAVIGYSLPLATSCLPCPPQPSLSPSAFGTDVSPPQCPSPRLTGAYVPFLCPAGSYNDMAGLALVTSDSAIRNLFSDTAGQFRLTTLVIFFIFAFSLATITHGCAVPAGLFVPLILSGGVCGRAMGKLHRTFFAGSSWAVLDEGTFAVLGSAAMLGGAMRMTVSLSVMLLEVTGNLPLLPLIMLVMTVAKDVGDCFNDGIVDVVLKKKKLPILDYPPPLFMKGLSARDAVQTRVVSLAPVERLGRIVEVLRSTRHSAFPVLQNSSVTDGSLAPSANHTTHDTGPAFNSESDQVQQQHARRDEEALCLCGTVLRSKLLQLLRERVCFQRDSRCTAPASGGPQEALPAEPRGLEKPRRCKGYEHGGHGDHVHGTYDAGENRPLLGPEVTSESGRRSGPNGADVEDGVASTECALTEPNGLQLADEFGLFPSDYNLYVDLHPYVNTSPYVVQEGMTLRKAYALFRRMALRHVCVVRDRLEVVGVLTRKDLLPHSYAMVQEQVGGGEEEADASMAQSVKVKDYQRNDTLKGWRDLVSE